MIFLFLLLSCQLIAATENSTVLPRTPEIVSCNKENEKQLRTIGYCLVALGLVGIAVAYINSVGVPENNRLSSIKKITSYEIPLMQYDFGLTLFLRNFCSAFWQKLLFFSCTGVVPGLVLLCKTKKLRPTD